MAPTLEKAVEAELLSTVFQRLGDGALLAVYPGRTFGDVNPAFLRMFGYAREDVLGQSLQMIHVDRALFDAFLGVLEREWRKSSVARFVWPLRRANGEIFEADITITVAQAKGGQATGVVGILRDLTAERADHERFRMLAENMSDVVSFTDPAGVIRYVSPSVQSVAGYAPEELTGRDGTALVHPDDLAALRATAAANPLGEWTVEYRGLRADGTWGWMESRTRAVLDPTGRYLGRLASARDITARRQAQEEAAHNEARWRSLVQDAPDFIYTVDREGRVLFLNHDTPGGTRDEIVGTTVFQWYDAADHPRVREAFRRVFEAGVAATYVTRAMVSHTRRYETRVSPVRAAGRITMATVVSRDITDRALLEEALVGEQRLAQTILDAQAELGEAIALVSESGSLLHVNRALSDLTGYERAEILRFPNAVARVTAPEAAEVWAKRFAAIARGESVPVRFDSWIRHKDGRSIPLEIVSTAVHYNEQRCRLYILRDLTTQREQSRQLETARAALAQSEKLAALGTLVSGVAHESRTPLTAMMNASHIIQGRIARGVADPSLAPLLDTIIENATRLNGFLDELRRFTRMGSVERVPLRLHEPVREALRLYVQTHPVSASIESRVGDAPLVLANSARLVQVVLNLVENASDATSGKGRVTVSIGTGDGGGAYLLVEDDGHGIEASVLARMFDPLFTTKEHGTGLGLAIVQRIAQEHGARISVDSAPGRGARIRLDFPPIP